jgi:hypothetical protein|nr:MAG TPA: hypothetical protein [Caudoviricetes sp.]
MKTVTLILADECDEVVSLTTFGTCKEDGKPKITTAAFSVKNGDVVRFPEDISIRSDELRCEINSTRNHDVKLMLALRCIELMTGEEGFERRNLNE